MRILPIIALPLTALLVATPVLAADTRAQDRFVDQVRFQAAFQNVEVNRISWADGVVTVHGTDREGNARSFTTACQRNVLDCPTSAQYAGTDNKDKAL